ncbi:MAG TPA: hypothetical protein VFB62_23065 [Polyangiaceae bacterium]|nr:hypothetical protein [Polyangiaceae bacterium]
MKPNRARMRGAAMVEGVVAIPFFILIFAGAMFAGGFYGRWIDTHGAARNETWKRAVNENCDDHANLSLPGLVLVDSANLGDLADSPLSSLCDKDFGSVRYTARSSFSVTGPYPFEKPVIATVTCPCNESPIGGDAAYQAAVEFLWLAYQSKQKLPPDAGVMSKFDWDKLVALAQQHADSAQ